MVIISITVYASDGTEVENRNDANNGSGQSTLSVSAFSHDMYVPVRVYPYYPFRHFFRPLAVSRPLALVGRPIAYNKVGRRAVHHKPYDLCEVPRSMLTWPRPERTPHTKTKSPAIEPLRASAWIRPNE